MKNSKYYLEATDVQKKVFDETKDFWKTYDPHGYDPHQTGSADYQYVIKKLGDERATKQNVKKILDNMPAKMKKKAIRMHKTIRRDDLLDSELGLLIHDLLVGKNYEK